MDVDSPFAVDTREPESLVDDLPLENEEEQASPLSVEVSADPEAGGAGDVASQPTPAIDQVVTHVYCEKCTTKGQWQGELTAEMLERTFTRGLAENGLPNCPHCGTAMELVPILTAHEAITQAAQQLDAERAGDAAKPTYQPSIPGIHPPFDYERAQRRTEALARQVTSAEEAWDAAKEEASDCKKTFDKAVETLRTHIKETAAARQDAEYQASKPASDRPRACAFERDTGKPCPICRAPTPGITPADPTVVQHLAAAASELARTDALETADLRLVIAKVAGLELLDETVRGWSTPERQAVVTWLEAPTVVERPAVLGAAHEAADPAGMHQACRICGGAMPHLPDGDAQTWPIGQLVGTDCPGEPAQEAARPTAKRHRKRSDAVKAKQQSEKADAPAKATKKKSGRR